MATEAKIAAALAAIADHVGLGGGKLFGTDAADDPAVMNGDATVEAEHLNHVADAIISDRLAKDRSERPAEQSDADRDAEFESFKKWKSQQTGVQTGGTAPDGAPLGAQAGTEGTPASQASPTAGGGPDGDGDGDGDGEGEGAEGEPAGSFAGDLAR